MSKPTPAQRQWLMELRNAPAGSRTLVPSPITLLSCVRRGWTEYRVGEGGGWEWALTSEGKTALETTPARPRRRRQSTGTPDAVPE